MVEKNQLISHKTFAPCLICAEFTYNKHLQVNICASCSAFYRRSSKLHKNFRCRRNTGKCDLTIKKIDRGALCRYCRYQKCIEIGVQLKNQIEQSQSCSINNQLEPPIFNDFDYIFEYVLSRFQEEPGNSSLNKLSNLNFTDEFSKLMSNFMEITKPQQTPTLMVDDEFRIKCLKTSYINIAQMLLAFTPYANLPAKEKIILHHEFWQIFIELGKCYQTCQYLGSNSEDSRSFADFHQYRDYEKEVYENNNTSKNAAANFMIPLKAKLIAAVKGFKKFNPTFFEFSLICQILLWSRCDILNLSNSTIQLADKITEQLWDSLHYYYVNELKLESYASRQAKLYRMISVANVIIDEEKEAFKAKDIFSFGNKNVIPCCKFKHGYFNYVKNKCLI